MSFPLHPKHVAAMYDCIRVLPPFDKFKLPESDEIEFRTPARADVFGEFQEGKPHVITISSARHSHTFTVMLTLAHEMLHLYQALQKTDNKNQHNAEFKRLAKRVCSLNGWDYKAF